MQAGGKALMKAPYVKRMMLMQLMSHLFKLQRYKRQQRAQHHEYHHIVIHKHVL